MANEDDLYKELSAKFKQKLMSELQTNPEQFQEDLSAENLIEMQSQMIHSHDYLEFKKLFMPKDLNLYEKMCKIAAKYFPVNPPDNETTKKIKENLKKCHLNITPGETMSFTYFYTFVVMIVSLFFSAIFGFLLGEVNAILFLSFGSLIITGFSFFVFNSLPQYFANLWRMKASNYLIQSLFYTVTFLRHTPNLERAINFTAEHLPPPLSLDFKRVLWDVETGVYSTVKDSLQAYLLDWQNENNAFVEAFSLVINSLNEGEETRRIELLDRALQILLDGTYERMLKYTHDLQQPVTMIHMLGVVMPMMATVMLPLVLSFTESARWYHVAFLYDVLLPLFIFWKTKGISSTRPGFGGLSTEDLKVALKSKSFKLRGIDYKKSVLTTSLMFFLFGAFFGLAPVTLFKFLFPDDFILYEFPGGLQIKLMDYRIINNLEVGPYSFVSAAIGLFFVLGLALGLGYYHLKNTQEMMKIRERTVKVEDEFVGVLFQLANRLNDGLPAEIAFQRIAESLPETSETKNFFTLIVHNISNRGMGLDQALYDDKYGAIYQYPSPLIKSTIQILSDASKKGPSIAGNAMFYIAQYMKQIKTVNQRIKDLLAESLASMKSIVRFMAPVLLAIISGLGVMISTIIVALKDFMSELSADAQPGTSSGLMEMLTYGVPTYYVNIAIGIYVILVIYILSELISIIENGPDESIKSYNIGKNLFSGGIKFVMMSAALTLMLSLIALFIVGNSF